MAGRAALRSICIVLRKQWRHIQRKIADAVLDSEIAVMDHIGDMELLRVFGDELSKGVQRVVLSALDLYRRDVVPIGETGLGNQKVNLHARSLVVSFFCIKTRK